MSDRHEDDGPDGPAYVSTGRRPEADLVERLVRQAHAGFKDNDEGENAQIYPGLARMPRGLFGVCVAQIGGRVWEAGDSAHEFTIMSVSKAFVFALVCQRIGAAEVRARIGVNATGRAFNAIAALEEMPGGRTNSMVNTGAIATTSLVPGADTAEKWAFIHDGLSRFAGRRLALDAEVHACAISTNPRNRAIARLLHSLGRLACDPDEALELYTRHCALKVTARDLAVMGATLANGGVNPVTRAQVVDPQACRHTLAVMATAGLYEASGDWLYEIGLPAKSGIGGGIVSVAPGKAGLGTFSPPLDRVGNSVRGRLAARYLSRHLGMGLFASRPAE